MNLPELLTNEIFMVALAAGIGHLSGYITNSKKQSNDFQRAFFEDQQKFRKDVLDEIERHKKENVMLVQDISRLREDLRLQHEQNGLLKHELSQIRAELIVLNDNYNDLLKEKQELLAKLVDQKSSKP